MAEATRASPLVLVKLGGSLITDKTRPGSVRQGVLDRLARELVDARASGKSRIIVGHGSGSFGHAAAREYGFEPSEGARPMAVAATQDAAARLHRRVIAALLAAGEAPFSIQPSSAFVVSGGEPEMLAADLPDLVLSAGLLPVIYGDVVVDRGRTATIFSTERLFLELVQHFLSAGHGVHLVAWLGETEGVLDDRGQLVDGLDASVAIELGSTIGGAFGADVTGGMRHRVEMALKIAQLGVPSVIADGRVPGLLRSLLLGTRVPGTWVRAAADQ